MKSLILMLLAATVWGVLGPVQNSIAWDLPARSAWGMLGCVAPILIWCGAEIRRLQSPGKIAVIAVCQAVSLPCWLISFGTTEVTRAVTLLFLHPVFTTLLDAALRRRLPRFVELAAALFAFAGVALIGRDGFSSGGIRLGDILALVSGASWSVVAVLQPRVNNARQSLFGIALGGLIAAGVLFGMAYIGRTVPTPSTADLTLTLGMGLIASLAWIFFAIAAQKLSPAFGALLLYWEFAVTFAIGVVVFGERPSVVAVTGTGMILIAMLGGIIGHGRAESGGNSHAAEAA